MEFGLNLAMAMVILELKAVKLRKNKTSLGHQTTLLKIHFTNITVIFELE